MDAEEGVYAFWDLIAQEAYCPKSITLQDGTWDRFLQNEQGKRVWIFACNEACRELIELYGDTWEIAGILDNAEAMRGKTFCGVRVYSPDEVICLLDAGTDVIILALRLNADIVAGQILSMGFSNLYALGVLLAGMEPYKSFIEEIKELITRTGLSDIVLMESMNDFDGNTGALYEYLKAQGSRHRFVWCCKSEKSMSGSMDILDMRLFPGKSVDDLKEYVRIRARAKWEIWECDPIRKVRKDQTNIFLQHYGMGYKQVSHLYHSPDYVDYVLTTNAFVHEMEKKSITYAPASRFLYGELPRNDVLFSHGWNELAVLTHKTYRKAVMWAPTLRESRYYHRVDSDLEYPFGISLIYEEEQMEKLNAFLTKLDILLVIKIHPRQKVNFAEKEHSNILYLDGDKVKQIHAYKLLTQMDALITDYSSIIFDYMLLDRPIAWVLEDREHYKIEYLMADPDTYMPGERIYTLDGLLHFLTDVDRGADPYQEARRKICEKCNPPFEGRGCERLAEALGL